MSLEATLAQTNELLTQLLTVLRTHSTAATELGMPTTTATAEPAADKPARTRKAKTEQASEKDHPDVVYDEGKPMGRVKTDPEGTRYFVIEKHNTVYAQKPGDPDCTIAGCEIVPAWMYLKKKAEFAAGNVQSTAAPTTAPAAAPAPSTPAASTASSTTSDDVPFSLLTEKAMELGKSTEPGKGREALITILKKWLPGNDKPTITALAPLQKNREILADVMAVLQPAAAAPAAAPADDFDPLA